MRRIIKNSHQPDFFRDWKRNYRNRTGRSAKYRDLQNDHGEYLNIKRLLINEQYHLCCYCCNRVHESGSHIEHFVPQSADNSKQLNYHNLHISCEGYIEDISTIERESCGHRKSNWYDENYIVSPLDEECEAIFVFLPDGTILPKEDDQRAIKMIENFGINSYALKKAREMAINTAFIRIGFYDNNIADKALTDEIYFNNIPNQDGELPPFCDAVSYVLNQI